MSATCIVWERRLGFVIATMAHAGLNIHIEDMIQGVHEHLMFGQGTIEFGPVFALLQIDYRGGCMSS